MPQLLHCCRVWIRLNRRCSIMSSPTLVHATQPSEPSLVVYGRDNAGKLRAGVNATVLDRRMSATSLCQVVR
jgi:hypothetical protein